MKTFADTDEHNRLISLGFKPYTIKANEETYKRANYFYQRKILNYDKQIMYFENIYVYDWREYDMFRETPFSFLVEARLYYNEKNNLILNFHRQSADELPLVFDKIEQIYENQECVPDPHNND